jgi:hypothetical protein
MIPERLFEQLAQCAEDEECTMEEYVEYLVAEDKKEKQQKKLL